MRQRTNRSLRLFRGDLQSAAGFGNPVDRIDNIGKLDVIETISKYGQEAWQTGNTQ